MNNKINKFVLSVIGVVCASIVLLFVIPKVWYLPPKIKVCIGSYDLSSKQKIVLHYLLPSVGKERKNILPFPLTIFNDGVNDAPNFLLHIQAKALDVNVNDKKIGWMSRLLDYDVNFSNGYCKNLLNKLHIHLQNIEPNSFTQLQVKSNIGYLMNFTAGSEISEFIVLNTINIHEEENNNLWDAFNIILKTVYCRDIERIFDIDVLCYYTDNDGLTIQSIRQKSDLKGSCNFVLKTEYIKHVMLENTIGNVYKLVNESDAIIELK